MPIDRMQDLKARVDENSAAESQCEGVAAIHQKLERLRRLNADLEEAQMQHLAGGDKKASKRIEKILGDIAKEGQIARNMIIGFGDATQRMESRGEINVSERSMRRNVFDNCKMKLEEVTKGSWDMQKQHEVSVTKQVEKRLRVRFADDNGRTTISEDEVKRIAKQLVDCGYEEQVFLMAKDELDKATRTRDAVKELEREMRDLYLVFCDLNTLVVEQHAGLNVAQQNVIQAHENVKVGQQKLSDAKRMQKRCCATM